MAANSLGEGGGDFGGFGESAGRAVEGDKFEGHLLRDGHHDLLELGFGAQADQPDFAAGRALGQVGGLIKRVARPRVEDGGEHHFILQRRAGRAGYRLQGLERVGHNGAADDNLICSAHAAQIIRSSRVFGKPECTARGHLVAVACHLRCLHGLCRGPYLSLGYGLDPQQRFVAIEAPSIVGHGSTWVPMGCAETSVMRLPDDYNQVAPDALAHRPINACGPRRTLAGHSP